MGGSHCRLAKVRKWIHRRGESRIVSLALDIRIVEGQSRAHAVRDTARRQPNEPGSGQRSIGDRKPRPWRIENQRFESVMLHQNPLRNQGISYFASKMHRADDQETAFCKKDCTFYSVCPSNRDSIYARQTLTSPPCAPPAQKAPGGRTPGGRNPGCGGPPGSAGTPR